MDAVATQMFRVNAQGFLNFQRAQSINVDSRVGVDEMNLHKHRSTIAVVLALVGFGCTDRNLDHVINLWTRATVIDEDGHPVSGADVVFQDLEMAAEHRRLYSLCSTDTSGRCEGRSRYGYNTTQRRWWWERESNRQTRNVATRRLRIQVVADGFEEKTVDVAMLTRNQVAGLNPVQINVRLHKSH